MFRSRLLDSSLPLPAGLLDDNAKNRGALIGRCITRCRARPVYAAAILVVVIITTVAAITLRSHITNNLDASIIRIQTNTQAADHIAGGIGGGIGVVHTIDTNTNTNSNTNTKTNTARDADTNTDTLTHTKKDADQAAAAAAAVTTDSTSIYTFDNDDLENKRNSAKDAFRHAWTGYERACWGRDELKPLSNTCEDWLHGGLTIIDSLSTLYVMSLSEELSRARDWVKREFRFDQDIYVSFFESTIRVLGGLLSAHSLSSGDDVYLAAARIAGQRLVPAFGSQTGIPLSQVNLRTGGTQAFGWTGGASLLAEIGTVQMEFATLSHVTGDHAYREKGQHVIDRLDQMSKPYKALYPIFISAQTGSFTNQKITLGAMGDSFYEYLLKMWLLTGKTNSQYLRMYRESADAVIEHLYTTSPNGDAYLADLEGSQKLHKMDHLVCFAPGMFALGVAHGAVEGDTATKHLDVAKKLMETCYQMYVRQPSGLAPEYVNFQPEMTPGHDQAYKLRPETVESLMILYRVTHDPRYREWGWTIFQGIERSAKVPNGYATVRDVTRATTPMQTEGKDDKMESFFLAETLKYLYLLFSPDTVIPITPGGVEASKEKKLYVFNTECHPVQAWTE